MQKCQNRKICVGLLPNSYFVFLLWLKTIQPLKHFLHVNCLQACLTCQCSGLPFFLITPSLTQVWPPQGLLFHFII